MKTTIDIPAQRIADMMCTALEHNDMTGAWCAKVSFKSANINGYEYTRPRDLPNEPGYPWYCCSKLFEEGSTFAIEVLEVIDESKPWTRANLKSHIVTAKDLRAGLKLMAEKHGRHFADMLAENDDAVTGDVFFQCIALKEVIYG